MQESGDIEAGRATRTPLASLSISELKRPGAVDFLLHVGHFGAVSFLSVSYVATLYSPQHFNSIGHLRRSSLSVAILSGLLSLLNQVREQKKLNISSSAKIDWTLQSSRVLHVLCLVPLVCVEFVDPFDPPQSMLLLAMTSVVIGVLTGQWMIRAGVYELASWIKKLQSNG
mmetsp:Transcript_39136/g.63449  ORF Transcript_39136/g.63449 Transcript_39136/m.63449 type:complete len:171 (+) Transcript_39136:707-1219(+)